MSPRRARDRRAVRRGITRDRPSLPRRSLNLFQPHGAGAGRYRRSARADVNQALPRPCRVDSSERHPGNIAKVSSMSDCLLCDWNRNRNFNVNRDLPADGAGGAVRGIAVVSGSQSRTPLHRAAREIALRTMKCSTSALWYWKFVQEPTLEGGIGYGGYFTQSRNQIVVPE